MFTKKKEVIWDLRWEKHLNLGVELGISVSLMSDERGFVFATLSATDIEKWQGKMVAFAYSEEWRNKAHVQVALFQEKLFGISAKVFLGVNLRPSRIQFQIHEEPISPNKVEEFGSSDWEIVKKSLLCSTHTIDEFRGWREFLRHVRLVPLDIQMMLRDEERKIFSWSSGERILSAH